MGLGNRDIFLWESLTRGLQATLCVRNKKTKQREKVEDFYAGSGKEFFSESGERKQNASERPTAIRTTWVLRHGHESEQPLTCGDTGGSPFHFYCFGRDYLTISQLTLLLKPYFYWYWCHLIAVKETIIRPDSITSTTHWPCPPLEACSRALQASIHPPSESVSPCIFTQIKQLEFKPKLLSHSAKTNKLCQQEGLFFCI